MSVAKLNGHCLCGSVMIGMTPAKPHLEACRRKTGAEVIAEAEAAGFEF